MKVSAVTAFGLALVASMASLVSASPAPAMTAAPPNPARRDFASDVAVASTNPLAIPGIVQSLIDDTSYLAAFQSYTSANTGAYSSILAQASTQLSQFVPAASVSQVIGAVQSSISNAESSFSQVRATQSSGTSTAPTATSTSRPDGALADAAPAHLAAVAAAGAAAVFAMLV